MWTRTPWHFQVHILRLSWCLQTETDKRWKSRGEKEAKIKKTPHWHYNSVKARHKGKPFLLSKELVIYQKWARVLSWLRFVKKRQTCQKEAQRITLYVESNPSNRTGWWWFCDILRWDDEMRWPLSSHCQYAVAWFVEVSEIMMQTYVCLWPAYFPMCKY